VHRLSLIVQYIVSSWCRGIPGRSCLPAEQHFKTVPDFYKTCYRLHPFVGISVIWHITQCHLVYNYRRFEVSWCLHFPGRAALSALERQQHIYCAQLCGRNVTRLSCQQAYLCLMGINGELLQYVTSDMQVCRVPPEGFVRQHFCVNGTVEIGCSCSYCLLRGM